MIRTTVRGSGSECGKERAKKPTLWERDTRICNIFTIYAALCFPSSTALLGSVVSCSVRLPSGKTLETFSLHFHGFLAPARFSRLLLHCSLSTTSRPLARPVRAQRLWGSALACSSLVLCAYYKIIKSFRKL